MFTGNLDNSATTFGSVTVNPLVAGADVICTFVNIKDPRIVIVKQTTGGDGTFNFTAATTAGSLDRTAPSITTALGTGVFNDKLTLGGSQTATVTLNETTPPTGFVFASVSCVNVTTGANIGTVSGSQVTLTGVTAGAEITCIYKNKVRPTISCARPLWVARAVSTSQARSSRLLRCRSPPPRRPRRRLPPATRPTRSRQTRP